MSIAVSIHQPNFLPWLKLLDKILASDVYIAYDTAQYTRSEFHSRQKVKDTTGPGWVTVPLHKPGRQAIKDVRIATDARFAQRQLKRLQLTYGKSPHFAEVYDVLAGPFRAGHSRLVDLNLEIIEGICRYLGSRTRIVRASELEHGGDRVQRLIQLVRAVAGDVHLTSTVGGADNYLEVAAFHAAGIEVRAQQFAHPVYPQPHGDFVGGLAAVDMLFACGRRTADLLDEGRNFVTVAADGAQAGLPQFVGKCGLDRGCLRCSARC